MKKQLMIAAAVATIGLTGLSAAGIANAETNTTTTGSTSIVDKLATKFGLKKADVQAVFDEEHAARDTDRLQNINDKLAAGVKAGTITQVQSDKLLAKIKEIQTTREANHDKMDRVTGAERKAAMEAKRTEITQWITDNKIPAEFAQLLHMGMGGHGGMDMHGHGHDMDEPSDSTTSTN